MATVTGYTAQRMKEIEDSTVVGGQVDENTHLILLTRDGTEIDAGSLPPGPEGPPGGLGEAPNDGSLYARKDNAWSSLATLPRGFVASSESNGVLDWADDYVYQISPGTEIVLTNSDSITRKYRVIQYSGLYLNGASASDGSVAVYPETTTQGTFFPSLESFVVPMGKAYNFPCYVKTYKTQNSGGITERILTLPAGHTANIIAGGQPLSVFDKDWGQLKYAALVVEDIGGVV